MYVYRLLKLALAAATLLGQSVIAQAACLNPSVRREWRSLSDQGRAEWISAVKVKYRFGNHLERLTPPCLVSHHKAS